MTTMDMDAAVRLVQRRQAERERRAAELQDRAILAEIAVDRYKAELRRRVKDATWTAVTFGAIVAGMTGLWLLTELWLKALGV